MKYWRGYLVAAIIAACTWGLREIAQTHTKLVDMIYPYVSRLIQDYMANWSSAVDFCVWQVLLLVLLIVALATVVLMIIFRWNPIQWFGWIAAAVSVVLLLNTGLLGLNEFAGPIAEDIRLEKAAGTQKEIEDAAAYYRDQANALSEKVSRDSAGNVTLPDLSTLNEQAVSGFENLVYDRYYSVFAGTTLPVKQLNMAETFTARGEMGCHSPITGEAAVNMEAPSAAIPYAISRQMCYRMSIVRPADLQFAAFLACQANDTVQYQYAGYLAAYRYCLNALSQSAAGTVNAQANAQVRQDLNQWNEFVAPAEKDVYEQTLETAQLLARWHIQTVVIPSQTEPETQFDPMDETQVDLTGLPHVAKAEA